VGGDIPIKSDALLVTDFVNFIKPAQSFRCDHMDRVCVHTFIKISAHTYINICIYIVFLKNNAS
jgi:hypothetical protein